MQIALVAAAVAGAAAQSAGSLTKEVHPTMNYQYCNSAGCKKKKTSVVIDSNWRWTHVKGETTNCYTGNEWDPSICPDEKTCTANCELEGAGEEYNGTYGVSTMNNDDMLELRFVTEGPYTTNIGSRVYMLNAGDDDKYKMFRMKNREITFTVDDSLVDCGLNGALYFVAMEQDGGAARLGSAGAKYGTGYCDAQCPHDMKWINNAANCEDWVPMETDDNAGAGKYGSCCTEIDLWEANNRGTAFTMHSCATPNDLPYRCHGTDCGDNGEDRFSGVCDKNGCDIQPYRFDVRDFYGVGSKFSVDSSKPITVTTQFLTNDGTDDGTISEVKQFYTQNGKTIQHPHYTINGKKHQTISDEMCADWVADTKDGTNFLEKGGMGAVDTIFQKGGVLVMSLWDDHFANMLWLDSTFPIDATPDMKGAFRGPCDVTTGVPADVEENVPDSKVTFSDIKYGKIGTTIETSSVQV